MKKNYITLICLLITTSTLSHIGLAKGESKVNVRPMCLEIIRDIEPDATVTFTENISLKREKRNQPFTFTKTISDPDYIENPKDTTCEIRFLFDIEVEKKHAKLGEVFIEKNETRYINPMIDDVQLLITAIENTNHISVSCYHKYKSGDLQAHGKIYLNSIAVLEEVLPLKINSKIPRCNDLDNDSPLKINYPKTGSDEHSFEI